MAGRTDSLKGTTSPDFQFGRRGPRMFSGTADPSVSSPGGPAEVNGDIYLRTLTGNEGTWQFKNGAWEQLSESGIRSATIDHTATQNIGTILPVGARVQRVSVEVTTLYAAGVRIEIRDQGGTTYLDPDDEFQVVRLGIFVAEQAGHIVVGGTRQIQAIVSGGLVGDAEVVVEYRV